MPGIVRVFESGPPPVDIEARSYYDGLTIKKIAIPYDVTLNPGKERPWRRISLFIR